MEKITLNKETCLNHLTKSTLKSFRLLSLKDTEILNRALRFFDKKKQLLDNIVMDEDKAMDIIFKSFELEHYAGGFDIEESTLGYYCIEFLKQNLSESKKKNETNL